MFRRTYYVQRAERRDAADDTGAGYSAQVYRDTSFASCLGALFIFLVCCMALLLLAITYDWFLTEEKIVIVPVNTTTAKYTQNTGSLESIRSSTTTSETTTNESEIDSTSRTSIDPLIGAESRRTEADWDGADLHTSESNALPPLPPKNPFTLWWTSYSSESASTTDEPLSTSTATSSSSSSSSFSSLSTDNDLSTRWTPWLNQSTTEETISSTYTTSSSWSSSSSSIRSTVTDNFDNQTTTEEASTSWETTTTTKQPLKGNSLDSNVSDEKIKNANAGD